jgi:hypothetical protein
LECSPEGLIFDDVPGMSSAITNSDDRATPLPDALIEVWRGVYLDQYQGYDVPLTQIQTGTTGRYTFTVMKLHPHTMISVHYQVSYQYNYLLAMQINVVSVPLWKSAFLTNALSSAPPPTTPLVDRIKEAGAVFHGPVDIVLPVPPPVP